MIGAKRLVAGAVLIAAAGAIVGPSLVGASGTPGATVAPPAVVSQQVEADGELLRCGDRAAKRAGALATALGLDPAAVTAALESVRADFVRPTFDDERPTREERAELRAQHSADLAAALGVTVEQLDAAREQLRGEHTGHHGRHFRGDGGGDAASSPQV